MVFRGRFPISGHMQEEDLRVSKVLSGSNLLHIFSCDLGHIGLASLDLNFLSSVQQKEAQDPSTPKAPDARNWSSPARLHAGNGVALLTDEGKKAPLLLSREHHDFEKRASVLALDIEV